MKFQGDLLLTDPMYIIKKDSGDDWNLLLSEGYDHAALHLIGIQNYLSAELGEDTVRSVINNDGVRIGSFCSDSSLFCVCDLKQVLAYNPGFLIMNAGYPDTFCVVRGFDGEIFLKTEGDSRRNIIAEGVNGFRTVSCSKGKMSIVKKYYCPLEGSHITVLRRDPFEFEEEHYDGRYLTQYADVIQHLFDEYIPPEGIAEYLGSWDGCEKVKEVSLKTEIHRSTLWGCFTVLLSEAMTEKEEAYLFQAIEGQTFAGVGESIMNGSIPTDLGEMTIALWTPETKLFTEHEFMELIQSCS